jgi:hypothetical protein
MPQLSAKGGVHAARQIEIVVVDPSQAVKEGGSDGKENHQHRHRHFGAHAKASHSTSSGARAKTGIA